MTYNKSLLSLAILSVLYAVGCTSQSDDFTDTVVPTNQNCQPGSPAMCSGNDLISCNNGKVIYTKCRFGCDSQTLSCKTDEDIPVIEVDLCKDANCPADKICNPATGKCQDPNGCFKPSDCPETQYCSDDGECIDLDEIECINNADCNVSINEECVSYKCVVTETVECRNHADCGDNRHCDHNHCEDDVETPIPPECEDTDQPFCEVGKKVVCVDGKIQRITCGFGQECRDGNCIDKICTAGEKACKNGQLAVCQSDHSWELSYCDAGTYCFEGDCIERGNAPEIVSCTPLAITGTNTCDRKGNGSRIVLQGDILGLSKTWKGGSVVVEGNHITYVGCDPDLSNATVITCPNAVISPGLINGHEHVTFSNGQPRRWGNERFNHRHEWRKGKEGHNRIPSGQTTSNNGNSVVEVRSLMAGTTAIFGSGSAPGLARNLDVKSQTVGNVTSVYQTFPLADGSDGITKDSGCSYTYDKSVKEFDDTCPYGPHIAEGINQAALNELRCLSGHGTGSRDIFKKNVAVIHGIGATVDIIQQMAANHVKLIWSPRTNISLYGDTAMAPLYDRLGVTIGLGTDWIYSGSATMLRELACVDYMNQNHYNHYFTDYDIWKMPTYNNAVAFGVEKYIGQIAAGMIADIVIFKTSPSKQLYRAVIDAQNADVTMVMVNGKFFFGDDNIMAGNGEKIDVCGVSKRFDLRTANAKDGITLAGDGVLESKGELSMIDAVADRLFYCDLPENEPTCVPQRLRKEDTEDQETTKYSGDFTNADDSDGDGIPNAQDNCPTMFNPVRAMDTDRHQTDMDNDGYGDICDLYPTCAANDDSCKVSSLDDLDGDTIPDDVDNCPANANKDQADADNDGKGDLCDPCPNDANPGNQSCPATLAVDFSCTTCKSGKGYSATYHQTFGDIEVSAVGNLQNYNGVYGVTLTGNPSTTPPTGIQVTGLIGLGTVTVQYISYNPTGGKGILNVTAGTQKKSFEHTYNASDTTPKETSFTFNDTTLTGFTIAPEIGSGSDGNNRNRIHITSVTWTLP